MAESPDVRSVCRGGADPGCILAPRPSLSVQLPNMFRPLYRLHNSRRTSERGGQCLLGQAGGDVVVTDTGRPQVETRHLEQQVRAEGGTTL